MSSLLSDLQNWYAAQCDGDWEHFFGITIETLDNPGWRIRIQLQGTRLDGKSFEAIEQHDTDDCWLSCQVEDGVFLGAGDPGRLAEIIRTFLVWAKSEPDWLAVPVQVAAAREHHLDERFWSQLGNEVGPETCWIEGCPRKRIAYSVYCKRHYFEQVRRKPCPFTTDGA